MKKPETSIPKWIYAINLLSPSVTTEIAHRNTVADVDRDRYWHDYYLSSRSDGETVATAYRLMIAGV
jgi:hypothetical protein